MRALSVIGTRPQYIKIKPIFDFCEKNNINHSIVDTCQHYSYSVSGALIKDLGLKIDHSLSFEALKELEFIAECTKALGKIFEEEEPTIVLVYGDTNSTFCAALAAYKMKIPIAHIEAGERCFDMSVPEEVNRIFVDGISKFNFCSSSRAIRNLASGIYCGDLEYELLNNLDPKISFKDFGVMTIHRQSNATPDRIKEILSFCSIIPYKIKFYAHHRTLPLLPEEIPKNIEVHEACPYTEMVNQLSNCRFAITDSGSVQKTSAFFGKRTLIIRGKSEWKETEKMGFAKLSNLCKTDVDWLLSDWPDRIKDLYLSQDNKSPAEIIFSTVIGE